MHPLVRDVYKRLMHVGRDYPQGLSFVREKAKQGFLSNATLTKDADILLAVNTGRWWVKEMMGVIQFKKYRAMRQRYGSDGPGISQEALEKKFTTSYSGSPLVTASESRP